MTVVVKTSKPAVRPRSRQIYPESPQTGQPSTYRIGSGNGLYADCQQLKKECSHVDN
jgi:hypothetical protein